ncbi:sensor histidine kinase [Ideonella paludis]|uniref:histidine kinase n=1 Tax=Ideonella paludis TaxID=1233411 RepID=A0ABS5DTQ4_9BURK|nr:HAMP domain-containing sensor histidine kinase [Ideonella paludis]MBQ0934535.1 HAMP domain-containing histidine kinase [Ideonella paludis]
MRPSAWRWPVLGISWRAALAGLVMAQVLWMVVGTLMYLFDDWSDKDLHTDGRHTLVFEVLRQTERNPVQQALLLTALNKHFFARDQHANDEPDLVTSLVIWRDGQLVYSPPHLPHPAAPTPMGEMVDLGHGAAGQLCKAEASSPYIVCFTTQGPHFFIRAIGGTLKDYMQVLLYMAILSGPFMLPIYWWAMGPVRRLSRQIAARQPEQLDPIDVQKHPKELRAMVAALNHWMAELQSSRMRERLFLANAAHELRTPLTAIQVNAEQLQRQTGPEVDGALAPLLSGCRRMTRVVEQLMRLVRHESEVMVEAEPQLLDLARVLESRLAELSSVADRKSVTLELQAALGLRVWAPPESLESLIDNIVGNAIKYVDSGGEVLVRLTQRDHTALLDVEDNGPGIAEADRERAFQRFTRLDNPRSESGAGLGLSIVQSVTQALGGQVALRRSERLGGLQVHIELPLKSI